MSDAVLRASSDAVKGLFGAWVQLRRLKAEDERNLRRQAAADLLGWIPELRALLYRLESSKCDKKAWRRVMAEAHESVRRVRNRAPRGWRHLRLSLFDAIGNGAGSVVWIDVSPSAAGGALTYDHRWTVNAAEYLDYMQGVVHRWGDEFSRRTAGKTILLSYNDWLSHSGRRSAEWGAQARTASQHELATIHEGCVALRRKDQLPVGDAEVPSQVS